MSDNVVASAKSAADYPACIPLYRSWLIKFLKYNEPRASKFRNSKKESIFGFIRAELSRIGGRVDGHEMMTMYSNCGLIGGQPGFFDAVSSLMNSNNIFADRAISIDGASVGPRRKIQYLQNLFEAEARDIKQRVATKLLRSDPIMDIVWYCALRRKEIAFLQMDSAFSEIGKPRVGPTPRLPGQRFDNYPDSTSPVIECNGGHLISYIDNRIGAENNFWYISERLEHGARVEYDLTVLERDEDSGNFSWHHFQESGKKPMQAIFDTITFLYDELVSSMRLTAPSQLRGYSVTVRRTRRSRSHTSSFNSNSIPSSRPVSHRRQRISSSNPSPETVRRRIDLIAKMWWWFCQAMPLYRGSAAVAEFTFMPMIELYTQYRYTVCAEKTPTKLVDIHALTYGKNEFVEMFRRQFLKRYVPNNTPQFDARQLV